MFDFPAAAAYIARRWASDLGGITAATTTLIVSHAVVHVAWQDALVPRLLLSVHAPQFLIELALVLLLGSVGARTGGPWISGWLDFRGAATSATTSAATTPAP
jgi:hypothetical protein